MGMPVRKLVAQADLEPVVYRFLDYYEPKTNKGKGDAQIKHPPIKTHNGLSTTVIMVSFLTTTLLAIGVHTTGALDKWGDFTKTVTKMGLGIASLMLGTAAAKNIIDSFN